MGDSKKNFTDENFSIYTNMVKYIRNLNMLEVHKREISQKLYNLHINLSNKNTNLEKYVVNPREFCDTICKDYIKNTPVYIVYLETVKKFSIVIAIMSLICDLFLKKTLVSKYFIYILIGTFFISMVLTYLKAYRSQKYGLEAEPLKYKILYNVSSLILIVPVFIWRNKILINGKISITLIGLFFVIMFFISSYIIKRSKLYIDKKISYKSI
ncbi:hypothetical protein GCM10008904_04080 [Paraclostridium ghonii]|uniref:Preprotein translocase subunit SecG n=1 Tax=Paraclostridium ghonii TaxID=29358 RepID=A0ABU0N0K6_9FIRM|nr:hypothetical protein [Paeniclostridium ghonii]MDQ0556690.1 preprotein translocase subunit SecG [Paeniclostridium ghonii]